MTESKQHHFKFFRASGLDQVSIRSGADIANVESLDQKLWVALSCPVRGVEFDRKTLELIDLEADGRVRVGELLAAVRWTKLRIKNLEDLLKGSGELPLSAINDANPEGAKLLAGARRILANLGKADAKSISLEDTADTKRIFLQTNFNGDGIIPVEAGADSETQKLIGEIIAMVGATPDRSGKPGINQAALDLFLTQAQALSGWAAQAESDPAILPLGAGTAAAVGALRAVRAKVDDFFVRCRLAAFDARAAGPMNRGEPDFVAFAGKDLTLRTEEVAKLPVAHVAPNQALPLQAGLNPAWHAAVRAFAAAAVDPLLGPGREALTEEEWESIKTKLAPHEAWAGAKPVTVVEKLGLERLRAILAGPARTTVAALIAQDAALEVENAQIKEVDQLIRYYRDLNRLLHNYVNLADFYNPEKSAIFQVGRLYLDGRACDLCFHVDDIAKHSTLAAPSKVYLAYCELVRPSVNQKRTICAAFTAGFAESLWVGRNGVFYDRQGNDWDAVIVKVVESPISLKEAFWSPWKKLAAMIADQFKKVLAAKESATIAAASKHIDELGKTVEAGKPAAPAPKLDGAAVASSIAAVGIAVGLLSQGAAKIFDSTRNIEVWQAFAGVGGVILAVSGPSVVLSYFRLRARDVAPILNASGWAVNSRIRMTLSLAKALTQEAALPPGSERQLTDPYAEDNKSRNQLIAFAVFLTLVYGLWKFDFLNAYLPKSLQHAPPAAETVVVRPK